MDKLGRKLGAGISLFLFAGATLLGAQNPPAAAPEKPIQQPASPAVPDHAQAYYHFMLARRYKELAEVYNRGEYIDRAVSEYKQAVADDPDSLFLRVELATLYWRVNRVGDAVREAESILKTDPNYPDAHRLLARIYWGMLGDKQNNQGTKQSLRKAIEHLEALTRIQPSDTDNWLALGKLYRMDNQMQKSEEAFRKVLNADPGSKAGLSSLAQLFFEQGEYDEALGLLKKIPDDELDPSLLGMLAYAYSQTHDFDNAVVTYDKALAQDPDNHELRRAYADALINGGKLDAARTELQKLLKADPEDGVTYLRMAQIDRQEGRFDAARQELDKAKSLASDNLEVPLEEARLEDTLGNDDKAEEILKGLVKQSERPEGQYTPAEANNRAIFLERLGMAYRGQNKYDEALATFRQMLALGKSQEPRAEALIVETLRLDQQPQKALAEADAALQKYPDERPLKVLRAYLLGEQGKVDEGVKALQALLNNTSADRDTYLAIAQVYSQAKRYSDAEGAIRKALALSSKPDDQNYAAFLLGSVYERQKKYDLAEEEFKKVLAGDPLNASAANYLGYMLADRGVRLEESVKYIKKALELDPNNPAYLDSLGWAYFKMQKYEQAEPYLSRAGRLMANDPTIHEHLGNLYLQMGKKALALQEWERALKEWPTAVSSDFDSEQAAKLQKQVDELKITLAREKTQSQN